MWVPAHCPHVGTGGDEFFDERSADVAGRSGDENGHVIRTGRRARKLQAIP
jgi:hypothetical protein